MTSVITTMPLADSWGLRPKVFRWSGPPALTPAEIWDLLDCGLLVSPYFEVRPEVAPAPATVTRIVQTKPRPGYADGRAIREHYAAGAVLTLNQVDHWHAGIKATAEWLRTELRADVRSSVVLRPKGTSPPSPALDGAHVLILQVTGHTVWRPGGDPVTLQPGDALYVPPDHLRQTADPGDESLHVAFTIRQPGITDLAELALANFLSDSRAEAIAATHHFMSPDEKVAWLRAELSAYLKELDSGALAEQAVRIARRGGQA
ncbi:hypothetical protein DQ384_28975 [Sphaerisporangium album]|uniref:Uncharacterized protein n=1 Tax=Sphaerisporangium album TaxID=509200 RepID=A0A367F966_9ACTN|nr:cupin domain-containing protein [Sphaerisporangium album]RCG26479.1 hypothetical protein DQ384_28975 [Sphaerisporangium album]